MQRIYSKINKDILLLTLIKKNEVTDDRIDLSPEEEILQVAVKNLKKGISFKPHKHNKVHRTTDTTQESWVFLSGKVEAKFYDIDDKIILRTEMSAGDCVVVFKAGHSFEVLEDNTIIYEFKNGPYYGVKADKTFIIEK
jgi:cupin fold WbuC family metalloprotein|tara:strand:+ start:176 stop:592 length:417 start_codon:yes stop_codon:yes gene_type:complete